ncbi:GNAT family N-acetyltransferase [Kineococcus sp. SYSU DK003]|uniref:GNAT family N-acetyltransferase n=1 Tax=Kineococcus sp. SYSU DK003 TaxID=3383124 RepID=UPI003D7D7398
MPATIEHLRALERRRAALAQMLSSPLPEGWPAFPEAVPFTREQLQQHPEQLGWWMHFFRETGTGLLVGSGGFDGPPRRRTVEIGYEIAPAFRGRRLGTAAAAALVQKARVSGVVDTVVARTLAEENASSRVLAALGFQRTGEEEEEEEEDPGNGAVWRWALPLA